MGGVVLLAGWHNSSWHLDLGPISLAKVGWQEHDISLC